MYIKYIIMCMWMYGCRGMFLALAISGQFMCHAGKFESKR